MYGCWCEEDLEDVQTENSLIFTLLYEEINVRNDKQVFAFEKKHIDIFSFLSCLQNPKVLFPWQRREKKSCLEMDECCDISRVYGAEMYLSVLMIS